MWYYVSSLTTIRRFSLKMKTVLSVVTTAMAAVLCSTSLAEGHAISAVKIPTGGYFDTGFVPKTNPKVTICVRRDEAGTVDVFGTQGRKAGCFILNDENGYYPKFGS